jgi:hypothetical protein
MSNIYLSTFTPSSITGINYSTIFVDAVYGNDSSGQRNNFLAPFKTISGAFAASSPGDTVEVCPGTYTDKNLQANAITVYFEEGVSLISIATTGTDACFKFDTGHNFTIAGDGHFRITTSLVITGVIASCPSIFRVSNVIANVEAGLIEGYQTDVSHTGNHFLCSYSGSSGALNLTCSNIAGNLPLKYIGYTGAECMYGLLFNDNGEFLNGNIFNLNINCNNNINTLYDGNFSAPFDANSQGQYSNIVQIFAQNTINCSSLILIPFNSLSFYKAQNLIFDNAIMGYTDQLGGQAGYYNFYCEYINGNIDPRNLNIVFRTKTGYNFYIDNSNSSVGNLFIKSSKVYCDFDFRNDQQNQSAFEISAPQISSRYIQYLAGDPNNTAGCILGAGVWTTAGLGFYQQKNNSTLILGSMLVDSGFQNGNIPIIAGNLIVNPNIYTL